MTTRAPKKRIFVFAVAILATLLAIGALLEYTGITNFVSQHPMTLPPGPTKQQKKDELKSNADAKKDFIESDDPKPTPTPSDNNAITLTATQEGQSVVVLTKLQGYPSGTCKLQGENGAASFSVVVDIIYQPEFSSCAGYTIPVSKLGIGIWSLTLTASQADGSSANRTTTVEVR